jgi:glycosyltransferase involved in cell wall biosynthesis
VTAFDLVHIHALYRFPQAVAAHYCRKFAVPYCLQPHGSLVPFLYHKRERRGAKRLYERVVENRNLREASAILYASEGEKAAVSFLKLGAPGYVVPNGLWVADYRRPADMIAFRNKHGLSDRNVILWLGRISPVKALDVLIEAFALLGDRPDSVLVIAGPDPYGMRPQYETSVERKGLKGRVVFTGMLLGPEKMAALQASDIFVLPSHTENFGIAALEAMAAGRAVIVSSGVKISTEIAAADAGKVVEGNPQALADALAELLASHARRAELGTAASSFAARFDLSTVVLDLERTYRAVLAGRAKSQAIAAPSLATGR